jgi:hypothetical protein
MHSDIETSRSTKADALRQAASDVMKADTGTHSFGSFIVIGKLLESRL